MDMNEPVPPTTSDPIPLSPPSSSTTQTDAQKRALRLIIIGHANDQVGKPYKFGCGTKPTEANPLMFDCSNFTRWCYHQAGLDLPEGSFNQYPFTIPTETPQIGDLGFFCNEEGTVDHVGIVYNDQVMVEARGEPFKRVIFRPRSKWESWQWFRGYRVHPKLI